MLQSRSARGLCRLFALLAYLALGGVAAQAASVHLLHIPGGGNGLGFDDLGFSPTLDRVLVPAARTGALVLVNPADDALQVLAHVVPGGSGQDRDDAGTTSADYGAGLLFASDHADRAIVAISPRTGQVVVRAELAFGPDYVRYVAPLHEVWVTEPRGRQIQRFSVAAGRVPRLRAVGSIAVPGGPESLVIDPARGVAYTNQWKNRTEEIGLRTLKVQAAWDNSCTGSRGLALATGPHLLFVGCREGKVVALDPADHGRVVASAEVGRGVDIIAWNPLLRHVYAPGAVSATLSVLELTADNRLVDVATVAAAAHSHCVVTDGRHTAYVCDPAAGALIVYRDTR
ncbi:MAG: hypothetical protein KGJ55_02260 [Gammaproteobacteria bacterium]|nr:hypothetical protein [Gammaproteobacteria bacterium]